MPRLPQKASAQKGWGRAERDLDGVAIDLVDPGDLAIRAHAHGGGGRVGHELPREDHVVGAERLAVVPAHVLLQAPGDGRAVLGETPVRHRRELGREHRHQVALGIVGDERLVEDPGRVDVLRAGGEVRVEQGRRLPPQRAQRPAPPRWRGVNTGSLGCAWTAPTVPRTWAAMGAVSPSPIRICVNRRRLRRPTSTSLVRWRSVCSSMGHLR